VFGQADRSAWGAALLRCRLAKLEPAKPAPAAHELASSTHPPAARHGTEGAGEGAGSVGDGCGAEVAGKEGLGEKEAGGKGKKEAQGKEKKGAEGLPPEMAAMFAEQRRKFLEEQVCRVSGFGFRDSGLGFMDFSPQPCDRPASHPTPPPPPSYLTHTCTARHKKQSEQRSGRRRVRRERVAVSLRPVASAAGSPGAAT
jgi:hypothetical protein